jgi:hypothetical protein
MGIPVDLNQRTNSICKEGSGRYGEEKTKLVPGDGIGPNACHKIWLVGSRVKLCVQISQASDVGSISIARSINPVDAVGFTGFPPSI